MSDIKLEDAYDDVMADHEEFQRGRAYERRRQHRYAWLKLFLYVYGASFLAFATVYLLVTWL